MTPPRSQTRRRRPRLALGDALAEVERSIEIPADVEDRILARLLPRRQHGPVEAPAGGQLSGDLADEEDAVTPGDVEFDEPEPGR